MIKIELPLLLLHRIAGFQGPGAMCGSQNCPKIARSAESEANGLNCKATRDKSPMSI